MPAKPGELAITGTIHGQKPTESDLKILFGVIENLLAPIEADWAAAARSAGMKDRRSFMVMYRRFRMKYNLPGPDGTKATTSTTAAGAAGAADGGSGAAEDDAAVETPIKKTSSRKKKPAANEGDSGLLLTPTTSMSTPGHTGLTGLANNLTMSDNMDFIDHEQPDTPSKSTTTTSGKKRNAAEAGNLDETPAKKKPVRKPRMTAKQKREAAAAAAAAAETTTYDTTTAAVEDQQTTVVSSLEPISSSMCPATSGYTGTGIDTTMEGMEEPGSEAAEALALALEVNAAAEAEEAAAVDGRADAVASPTEI